MYNAANGTCFTAKSTVSGPGQACPDLPTVDLEVKEVPFATLYTRPPDDGLEMGPKRVEAW
jgi:hypothetical protein